MSHKLAALVVGKANTTTDDLLALFGQQASVVIQEEREKGEPGYLLCMGAAKKATSQRKCLDGEKKW